MCLFFLKQTIHSEPHRLHDQILRLFSFIYKMGIEISSTVEPDRKSLEQKV